MKKLLITTALIIGSVYPAFAQEYPQKPITLVVGFPPGGGADAVARIVSDKLSRVLEQPIIITIFKEVKEFITNAIGNIPPLFEKSYRSDWLGMIRYRLYG